MASQAARAERLLGQEEPLKIKAENVYNEGGVRSTRSRIRASCSLADCLKTYNTTGGHCAS